VKQVAVISGKGGTGKTSIVASFADLADNMVLADCDVDAADLHLLLHPEVKNRREFVGLDVATINPENCTECGLCEQHCRFDAITDFRVDSILCEGCGVCAYVCPADAVELEPEIAGEVFISDTYRGPMVHARLYPGSEASGKLVAEVRMDAQKVARETGNELVIIDGSPGIGCPVIASITGVDLAVCVSEPSVAGLHDLDRIHALLKHFEIPAIAVVNRFDINEEITEEIEALCRKMGVEVAARIPYDTSVVEAMIEGKPATARPDSPACRAMTEVWETLLRRLGELG